MPIISKSKFVSGYQCHKKIYYDIHRKELKLSPDSKTERSFSSGNAVGLLAQQCYPNGYDARANIDNNWTLAIERTQEWIESGVNTIYEASFSNSNAFAALDILHYTGSEYWAIEVKSTSGVEDYHIIDASLQYWVMNKCGLAPDKFYILHINNKYVKDGPIVPKELFTLSEITSEVLKLQDWVTSQLTSLQDVLSQNTEPTVEIGKHCFNPFDCDYIYHCWRHIPQSTVFQLVNARGKDWDLYHRGILDLKDIPDEELKNFRQKLQLDGVKNNSSHINKEDITQFLNQFKYPLYFFDFETIAPAIPPIDGASPYTKTPFQYSLHILESPNAQIVHKEYLANTDYFSDNSLVDPRRLLLEQLQRDIGPSGSIVAYNASFEIGVLKGMISLFPELQDYINNLCKRFVDLLIPFRSGWYYLPAMGKSASIKSVLPALAPEFNYNDLVIGNGGDASEIYLSMINKTYPGDYNITRNHLLEYCKRDTYGMVIIYNELQKVLKEK